MSFLLGVLASAIWSLLILLASRLWPRWRTVIVRILNSLVGHDVEFVYRAKLDAKADMRQDMSGSDEVLVFTGRGNELQRSTFSPLFLERRATRGAHVRVLLPASDAGHDNVDWLEQREIELSRFDPAFVEGFLKKQVEANVALLKPWEEQGVLELRRFNFPHIGRIVIAKGHVYFTPYNSGTHGRESKVIRYTRSSEMGQNLERLFEMLWVNLPPSQ